MFLRNAWYVAATSKDLASRGIIGRKLLNEGIVLFRTEAGNISALRDGCIHRHAPLSLGKVVGETLQCGYHGARFDTAGHCVHIPGQSSIPSKARVRCYPVMERYGFVWLWMGDAQAATDESAFPGSFKVDDEPGYRGGDELSESIKINYRLLNDNLFDITHAEFVHPNTFGGQENQFYRNAKPGSGLIDRGMTYEVKETSVHTRVHAASIGDEGAPLWRVMMAQAHNINSWPDPVDLTMEMNWWAPCYTSFHVTLYPVGRPAGVKPVKSHKLHAAIPETETTTHYFYRTLVSYGDDALITKWIGQAKAIQLEDLMFMEGQQAVLGDGDPFDVPHISFQGDQLQIAGRRILERLIKAEQSLGPVTSLSRAGAV
jgi:phenylpropionate dioxygenase-like ring-hydroxylating dioxygenase large terminal subunit